MFRPWGLFLCLPGAWDNRRLEKAKLVKTNNNEGVSMQRELMNGNEAVVRGVIMAGCTHYFCYPVTPSSEVIHAVASLFQHIGACFVQAESEVAAINMCYGAAAAGRRVMTASSGPGISLKTRGYFLFSSGRTSLCNHQCYPCRPGNIFPERRESRRKYHGYFCE